MNRFLATTAIALLMGAAPALAQSPETPSSPPQEPSAQAPMEPSESSPPSAIPSEPSEPMKAPDQSSEAPKPILPDQNAQEQSAAPEQSAQGGAQFINEQKTDDILASTIIGKPAVNSQDEGIGDVNDLVTDRSGKIIAALIGVGGFLGIGEKNVAVRFEDLKLTPDENNETKVVLNVSKDTLTSAPDYKTLKQKSVVEGSIKSDSDSDKTGSSY